MRAKASSRWPASVALAGATTATVIACSSFQAGSPIADAGVPDAAVDVAPPDDASAHEDAPVDAGALCDPASPFTAPVLVPALDIGDEQYSASLTPDQLSIAFASSRGGTGVHLWYATRADPASAFGEPVKIAGLDFNGFENDYWLTQAPWTGKTVYFCSTHATATNQIWSAEPNDNGVYGSATQVTAVAVPGQQACHPHAARHANELWISGSTASGDIFVAQAFPDGGFATPAPVLELNTTAQDFAPVLSDDGLVIYWGSTRKDTNAGASSDIWVATRGDPTKPFTSIRNVSELNAPQDDYPLWLSPDRCRLYLMSSRSGRRQILSASRTP